MKHFPDPLIPTVSERIPNPSYNEEKMWEEVEEARQRLIKFEQREVNESTLPKFKALAQQRLDDLRNNTGSGDKESVLWMKIHELSRNFPFSMDRSGVAAETPLQSDLDAIIRQHYDYNRFIQLCQRQSELFTIKNKRGKRTLPSEFDAELVKISTELHSVILPKLYIEMRRLGYSNKELHTG